MMNKIYYIREAEAEAVKTTTLQDVDTYLTEIDGAVIQSEKEYVLAMAVAFGFVNQLSGFTIEWCNDYIHDLRWIKHPDIVLLIRNYDRMLIDDPDLKKAIIAGFAEITLPWREGEVVGHMVGGNPRRFLIYLETDTETNKIADTLRQSIKQYKEFVKGDESFSEKGEVWYMMGQAYRQLADFKKAFTCFKKAAAHDYSEAFAMVGDAYLDELGVEKNPVKARLWYRKGTDMGEMTAILKLADCYKCGIGGSVDYSKAMEQYLHLAERTGRFWNRYADGIGTALYEIGNMYLNGLGVPVDLKKAVRYFKLAAKKGNTDAEKTLKTVIL